MSEETKCPNRAEYRFTWPGKDESFVCMGHSDKLRNVAQAIGLHVQLIPIHESDFDGEMCQQKLSIS